MGTSPDASNKTEKMMLLFLIFLACIGDFYPVVYKTKLPDKEFTTIF